MPTTTADPACLRQSEAAPASRRQAHSHSSHNAAVPADAQADTCRCTGCCADDVSLARMPQAARDGISDLARMPQAARALYLPLRDAEAAPGTAGPPSMLARMPQAARALAAVSGGGSLPAPRGPDDDAAALDITDALATAHIEHRPLCEVLARRAEGLSS